MRTLCLGCWEDLAGQLAAGLVWFADAAAAVRIGVAGAIDLDAALAAHTGRPEAAVGFAIGACCAQRRAGAVSGRIADTRATLGTRGARREVLLAALVRDAVVVERAALRGRVACAGQCLAADAAERARR